MTIRQARLFAIIATLISTLAFLGLTLDSHRQFPELTNENQNTPEVQAGMAVWHKYNCINCHTLFGEGAYYAPDLTKIAQHRGEPYLRAFMRDPSQFYDEKRHRRLMPNQDLEEEEITNLIKFLDWVSKVDNQGWPPRPILVAGGFYPNEQAADANPTDNSNDSAPPGVTPVDATDDPRALGQNLFRRATPTCAACHSVSPGADGAGPTLAGVATRAAEHLAASDYTGQADTVEAYLRESISHPSAYLVPGAMYSAGGVSFMPTTYVDSLSDEELDNLAAYLASLK